MKKDTANLMNNKAICPYCNKSIQIEENENDMMECPNCGANLDLKKIKNNIKFNQTQGYSEISQNRNFIPDTSRERLIGKKPTPNKNTFNERIKPSQSKDLKK